VANNIVYVTGGRNGTTLATVERALIAPNLGLGSFTATSNLIAAREGHTSVVLGDKLYVIGGRATPTPYRATIEVATINGDGTLGAFATASMSLQVPRAFHTSAVVGRYLYVFGGENAGTNLASVERAPISADGTLGAFATVSGVTLNTARNKLAAVALGSSVVLVGGTMGQSDQGILTSIERAALE
jgi:N-acetylneuraminic acid mutarotase